MLRDEGMWELCLRWLAWGILILGLPGSLLYAFIAGVGAETRFEFFVTFAVTAILMMGGVVLVAALIMVLLNMANNIFAMRRIITIKSAMELGGDPDGQDDADV